MKLLFAGTPVTALPALAALLDAGHDVVAVVSNPDAPVGRGQRLVASPVADEARRLGIPLLQPQRARESWFVDAVTGLGIDAAVIVAWGRLIPDGLLAVPKHGWINLHFSLLPAWRGAAPVQRTVMAGESATGVTTFRLVHDLDAGPVWRHQAVAIGADETAGDLLGRLAVIGADVLARTLEDVASGVAPTPQPIDGVSLAPKVTVDDARADWTRPVIAVHNQVRGVTPEPGAWTMLDGQRLKILGVMPVPNSVSDAQSLKPGELLAGKRQLLIGTGDGVLELMTVQAPGKPPMAGADWARGARLTPGVRCE